MKKWLKYLGYILLIIILISLREYVTEQFKANFKHTFRYNFYLLAIIMIINVGIGLMLGLEHLIGEVKKDGIWKINLSKLVSLALPTLFLLTCFLGFSRIPFIQKIFYYPSYILLRYGANIIPIFLLILGYGIITSFYKRSEK